MRYVAAALLFIVLMAAGALLWVVGTERGGAFALEMARRYTARLEMPVAFDGFSGNLWRHPALASLSVADRDGVWLVARDIRINWSPLALLHGKPWLHDVDIASVQMQRLPVVEKAAGQPLRKRAMTLADALPYVPQHLTLGEFIAEAAVTGQRHRLQAQVVTAGDASRMQVSTLEGPVTALSGTLVYAASPQINLSVTEEPNGLIGALASLPPTHIAVDASGTLPRLSFRMAAASDRMEMGSVQARSTRLHAHGTVDVTDFAVLPFQLDGTLAGDVIAAREAAFPLSLTLVAQGTRQAANTSVTLAMQRGSDTALAHLNGQVDTTQPRADVSLTAVLNHGPQTFNLRSAGTATPDAVRVAEAYVKGPGIDVSASGAWDISQSLASGNGVVEIADLRPLAAFFGVDGRGQASAVFRASTANGAQQADVRVNRLNLSLQGQTVALQGPATLHVENRTGFLVPFTLRMAGGSVTGSGTFSPTAITGRLAVRNFDLSPLLSSLELGGNATGNLNITGSPGSPRVIMEGTGTLLIPGRSEAVQGSVSGSWVGMDLRVSGRAASGPARLRMDGNLRAKLSLMPFVTDISARTQLNGTLAGNLPLEMFNTYLWPSRQRIGGVLGGNATLGGTLGQPQVNGRFSLVDGTYDHSDSGVCLRNVRAEIAGTASRVVLQSLTAADSHGGSLNGRGELTLQGDRPLSANLQVHKLQLFCGGLASGVVGGELQARGTLADNTIGGTLTLGPLNIQVPGRQNETNIPQVETRRAGTRATAEDTAASTRFNITVQAPNQIFVRGRGLDAEFGGDLHIGGNARRPVLAGDMTSQRGKFTLLDRTLQLTATTIRFEGPIPPSPFLAIKATTLAQGTTIEAALNGPAQTPTLTLSSQPSLPQDEILALLLFGRKLQAISPFQAIRLAQATRQLAGLDSDPGLLDKARNTLGLDTLDIGTSDNTNDLTVTTGKYIGDKIYVSIQQGTAPEDREVKTEIELTPSISGNTSVNGLGQQKVGVGWKRDY